MQTCAVLQLYDIDFPLRYLLYSVSLTVHSTVLLQPPRMFSFPDTCDRYTLNGPVCSYFLRRRLHPTYTGKKVIQHFRWSTSRNTMLPAWWVVIFWQRTSSAPPGPANRLARDNQINSLSRVIINELARRPDRHSVENNGKYDGVRIRTNSPCRVNTP